MEELPVQKMVELDSEFSFFPTGEQSIDKTEIRDTLQPLAKVQYRKKKNKDGPKLHGTKEVEDDDDIVSVDENLEIQSLVSSVEDRLSCRGRLQFAIHSLPVQIFVLSLVIVDALTVLCELLLDVGAFDNRECYGSSPTEQADFCHYDVSFRFFCPPSPIVMNVGENLTAGNGKEFCVCAYREGKYTCAIDGLRNKGIDPASILHIISLVILTIFLVEISLKLLAFRMKFFTHKFEVFDALIVLIAWILDVSSFTREEAFFQFGVLIVVLRLWRVVRIVNGGVLSAKSRSDKQLQSVRSYARDVVHALHKAQKKLSLQQDDINKLSNELDKHNLPLPDRQTFNADNYDNIPEYPYDKEENINFGWTS